MIDKEKWKIKESAEDWECDWKGDELFHLRYFRALSMVEKIKAVEEMCRIASKISPSVSSKNDSC